ncbi:hypothetical protein GPECTOR_19g365 [Gonium pectorale]|uniref:Uncharacterized protein n=1 Tax=Gonium pectorale TaxID=33097 RepID=A0A150GJH6_GONPE|nr:hypothetical protein GPECTOR_19g365 [Gonium pectorale]|eukprot:KXZ49914.1 hypothetical protein GPECTOR_19g365 [Gonium pectorale]
MGELAAGAGIGIGISIGFCLGVAVAVVVMRLLTPRSMMASKSGTPQKAHTRPGVDTFPSHVNLDTQPVSPQDDVLYSPLATSMVKSRKSAVGVKNSANMSVCLSPEATAALGGHGSVVLNIMRPAGTSATPGTALSGQFSNAVTPTRPPPTQPFAYGPGNLNSIAQPEQQPAPQPQPASLQQQPAEQKTPVQKQPTHQRMVSLADAYGAEEMDDEWAVVLGDLDGMLERQGQPRLASPERAVAVKTLIRFTGSRGMKVAMEEALNDVLRYRK